MKEKRIVVALGRNAFGETFPEQKKNVKKAAQAIADLVEQKYQIVITHSNGPQVGMIQTAMTEFARLDNDKNYTVAPMSLCGAMSDTNVCMLSHESGIYRIRFAERHSYRIVRPRYFQTGFYDYYTGSCGSV